MRGGHLPRFGGGSRRPRFPRCRVGAPAPPFFQTPLPPAGRFRGAGASVAGARRGGGEGGGGAPLTGGRPWTGGGCWRRGGLRCSGPGNAAQLDSRGRGSWGLPRTFPGRGGRCGGDHRVTVRGAAAPRAPTPGPAARPAASSDLEPLPGRPGPRAELARVSEAASSRLRRPWKAALSHASSPAKAGPSPTLLPAGLRGPPRAGGGARGEAERGRGRGERSAPRLPALRRLPEAASLGDQQATTSRLTWRQK